MADKLSNIQLFSQLGIETRGQEQILAEKEQARVAAAMGGVDEREWFPGENDLEKAGAFLGAFLVNKFKKPELSPEEKRDLAAKEFAQTGVKTRMEDDEEFRKSVEANPQLASIETLRQMSKFYYDSGDITLAAEVSAEAGRQYMAFRQQQAELAKMEEETTASREKRKREGEKHKRDIENATSIILPGKDGGFNLQDLENQVVTGRWDPDKEAFVTSEGMEAQNFMTLEEAISLRELAQDEMEDAGVSDPSGLEWDARVRLFNSAISSSERTGLRMQMDALDTQSAIMNRTADMFEEFIDKGQDPAQFLDGAGKIFDFTTNVAQTVESVGRTFMVSVASGDRDQLAIGKGEVQVTNPHDMEQLREAGYGDLIDTIEMPEWVKESKDVARASAEYQSAIIQLAYAVARSNEPGARQLSDTDFKNALKELGAAAADPEKLRRVIFSNFERKATQIGKAVQRVGEIGSTFGLNPEQARDMVYGGRVRAESLNRFGQTLDRYEGDLKDKLQLAEETNSITAATGSKPVVSEEADQTEEDASDNVSWFLSE